MEDTSLLNGVWSRAVTSIPLNNASSAAAPSTSTAASALMAMLSAATGGKKEAAVDGVASIVASSMTDKDIVFALTESPLVLPIPLCLVDGSIPSADGTVDGAVGAVPQSVAAALEAIGVYAAEKKVAMDESGEEEGATVRGVWRMATFDTKLLPGAANAVGGVAPFHMPYLLISIGNEDGASVPMLLRVLTIILEVVNEKSAAGISSAASSIGRAHQYYGALAALGRLLYTEYSVSVLSMTTLGDGCGGTVTVAANTEAPTAHPMEAAVIDAWQPLLMATLLFATGTSTCRTTSGTSAFDCALASELGYASMSNASLEAFISAMAVFHARYAQPIMAYVADLATYVQAAGAMLLSGGSAEEIDEFAEEAEAATGGAVNPDAAVKFLQLFPIATSAVAPSSAEAEKEEASNGVAAMPLRLLALGGSGYAALFTDDTIDASLAKHCERTLGDEAACDDFYIPLRVAAEGIDSDGSTRGGYLIDGDAFAADVVPTVTPYMAAAAVKRYARHLLHGLRSDDFIDVAASVEGTAYERAAHLDDDGVEIGMAMDMVYDNGTSDGLRVASVLGAMGCLVRAVLWEGLVGVALPSSSAAGGPSVMDLSSVAGKPKAASIAAAPSQQQQYSMDGIAANNTASLSFKQLCQSFTSLLRSKEDDWCAPNAHALNGASCSTTSDRSAHGGAPQTAAPATTIVVPPSTNVGSSAPSAPLPFGGPRVTSNHQLYTSTYTSGSALSLVVGADDTLHTTCRNTADLLARIASNSGSGAMVAPANGQDAAPSVPIYALIARHATPSAVSAVLLALFECLPISTGVMAAFPSPSAGGYSPSNPGNAPRCSSSGDTNVNGRRNVHEMLFDRFMAAGGSADAAYTPLWTSADMAGVEEAPTVDTYDGVCAAHYTLCLLGGGAADEVFAAICVPLHLTAHTATIADDLALLTSHVLPHPLTKACVRAQSPAYAAWLLHFISLHSSVQEGHTVLFLEKAIRTGLAFTKVPSAPRPEHLALAVRATARVGATMYTTTVDNPYIKARRVRLSHVYAARQLAMPTVTMRQFSDDADALRGGVKGYAPQSAAEEGAVIGAVATLNSGGASPSSSSSADPSHPLFFLWQPSVKAAPTAASSATPTAQQAFMHSANGNSSSNTTSNGGAPALLNTSSGGIPANTSLPSSVVAAGGALAGFDGLDFDDLFRLVREYDGDLEVLDGETVYATGAALLAPSLAQGGADADDARSDAAFSALSGGGISFGDGGISIASLSSAHQREVAACLAQGAMGTVAAVYSACNSLKMPAPPLVVPTAAMQAYYGAEKGSINANFDILFTDLREELLPVGTAADGGARSPRPSHRGSVSSSAGAQPFASSDAAAAKSSPFVVSSGNSSSADPHLSRRFLLKLCYALNHPSVVAYLLTAPETHADRFHELFNRNTFETADEKRQIAGFGLENASAPPAPAPKKRRSHDSDDEDGDDADATANAFSGDNAGSGTGSTSGNKKYKTRLDMLYDLVLSPITLYERRIAAAGTAHAQAAKCPATASEGGFALSPWLVLWYKFFVALAANAERRMVHAEQHNTKVILGTAAAEVGGATTTTAAAATPNAPSSQKGTVVVGVSQDILHVIVEIVEELQTLCPALALTTTEGLAKHKAEEAAELAKQNRALQRQQQRASTIVGASSGGASSAAAVDADEEEEEEESKPKEVPLADKFAAAQKGFGKVADKHPNDVKLLFYSLFKQATVGDVNISKPWAVDITGRAKYDAWARLKGKGKEEAMVQYVAEWEKLSAASSRI